MKKIFLFLSLFFLVGCGSFKKKDEASVQKIKKVAVIAFTDTEPQGKRISLEIGKGLGAKSGGSILAEEFPHAEAMYNSLGQSLKKNLKWQVMGLKEVANHPAYQNAYKGTMEGWQNKMPSSEGYQDYQIKNIMDWQSMRLLGPEGRTALIKSLGVDAIIMARSYVSLEGTTVMGIGSKFPQTHVTFEVYALNQKDPVWRDSISGKKAEKSVGATAFLDNELLKKLSLESFQTAAADIGRSVN